MRLKNTTKLAVSRWVNSLILLRLFSGLLPQDICHAHDAHDMERIVHRHRMLSLSPFNVDSHVFSIPVRISWLACKYRSWLFSNTRESNSPPLCTYTRTFGVHKNSTHNTSKVVEHQKHHRVSKQHDTPSCTPETAFVPALPRDQQLSIALCPKLHPRKSWDVWQQPVFSFCHFHAHS